MFSCNNNHILVPSLRHCVKQQDFLKLHCPSMQQRWQRVICCLIITLTAGPVADTLIDLSWVRNLPLLSLKSSLIFSLSTDFTKYIFTFWQTIYKISPLLYKTIICCLVSRLSNGLARLQHWLCYLQGPGFESHLRPVDFFFCNKVSALNNWISTLTSEPCTPII